MADAQKKTVPFPGAAEIKDVQPVHQSPWHPVVEKFVVPAIWFGAGMIVMKLVSKSRPLVPHV